MEEKFYFVFPHTPCAGGFVLAARTVREARKKAWDMGLFPCDYIDVRARLLRDGKDADYEHLRRYLSGRRRVAVLISCQNEKV